MPLQRNVLDLEDQIHFVELEDGSVLILRWFAVASLIQGGLHLIHQIGSVSILLHIADHGALQLCQSRALRLLVCVDLVL